MTLDEIAYKISRKANKPSSKPFFVSVTSQLLEISEERAKNGFDLMLEKNKIIELMPGIFSVNPVLILKNGKF
jgi:hypothetical protein